MIVRTLAVLMTTIALVACGGGRAAAPSTPTRPVVETTVATQAPQTMEETSQPENVADEEVTATTDAREAPPTEEPAVPAATELTEAVAPQAENAVANNTDEISTESPQTATTVEPIEVTYFTPSQAEGPYYPVAKLADQDNDLTVLDGAGGSPAGQIVEFTGTVYDATGVPVEGVTFEIWQTDTNGIYLHPGDPQTEQRDRNFQFYGEAITAADGSYGFRTILPGQYEPRPRHIHAKIKDGQKTLLTTQIYFDGDPSLEVDGIFLGGGNENVHLVMTLAAGQDGDGNQILVGEHDIILETTLSTD